MYGLHVDWPLEWTELEKFYCEAERRLGVSGEPSPLPEDRRSEPYPMPAMVMSHNLIQLKKWAEQSGIPFWTTPQAKNTRPYGGRAQCIRCNTCSICPTGARYSPDFTFKRLLAGKNFALHERTLVRKLVLDDSKPTIAAAQAVNRDAPDDPIEYRAPLFVLASGYCWSPHLLLLSRCSRFPDGLANRSQLVGRYMCGHAFISAQIEIDAKIYPGMNEQHGLISRQFFRCRPDAPFLRHDLRIWESAAGHDPRLRSAGGRLLLGDELLADWRERAKRGTARVRGYYDVHPDRDSSLTLDDSSRNRWGDPMPKIEHKPDAASQARPQFTRDHFQQLFQKLSQAGNGKILNTSAGNYWDHPAGGCRMGSDPDASVCDSSRADSRSREPVRGRFAHTAQRRMHQRHPDLRGVDAAFGRAHRGKVPKTGMKTACVLALLSALAAAQEWPYLRRRPRPDALLQTRAHQSRQRSQPEARLGVEDRRSPAARIQDHARHVRSHTADDRRRPLPQGSNFAVRVPTDAGLLVSAHRIWPIRPRSVSLHPAPIQPCCSRRCGAGYARLSILVPISLKAARGK